MCTLLLFTIYATEHYMKTKQLRGIQICIDLINLSRQEDKSKEEKLQYIDSQKYVEQAKEIEKDFNPDETISGLYLPPLSALVQRPNFLDLEKYIFNTMHLLEMDDKEMYALHDKSEDQIFHYHLLKQIVKWCVDREMINEAVMYTEKMPTYSTIGTEDHRNRGYRIIARYYAKQGALKEFSDTLKKCDARRSREEIEDLKQLFIQNYSIRISLKEAIEFVVKRKEFGIDYLLSAYESHFKNIKFNEIESLLKQYPELDQPKIALKENIYTRVFIENPENLTRTNFETAFAIVNEMNSKLKYGDFKLRDFLLGDIAFYLIKIDKKEYLPEINRCSKAVKNSSLKREIKFGL